VASLESREAVVRGNLSLLRRTATIATLIIVQAKVTVDLCHLYRILHTESPAGTTGMCEFDFASSFWRPGPSQGSCLM
jgi:hypothetical protein